MIGEYISNRSNLQVLDCFVKWVTPGDIWDFILCKDFCINFSITHFTYGVFNIWTLWSMVWRCLLGSDRSHTDTGKPFLSTMMS
jgi:hypothetical protein